MEYSNNEIMEEVHTRLRSLGIDGEQFLVLVDEDYIINGEITFQETNEHLMTASKEDLLIAANEMLYFENQE